MFSGWRRGTMTAMTHLTRRNFLGAFALPQGRAAGASTRPDIIYITADQQRADQLSCNGHAAVHTPHLDRLAKEGAVFPNAFCQFPVCVPSRTSMFTGRYPHAHRVGSNEARLPADEILFSELLQGAGYFVGGAGMLEQDLIRPFDEFTLTPGARPKQTPELSGLDRAKRSAIFSGPEERHRDVRCLRAALRMMERAAHPQFIHVSFHQPHGLVQPLERFARKYDPARIPLPESFAAGLATRGEEFQRAARKRVLSGLSRSEVQTIQARVYASVEMIDSFVGEIVNAVERRGTARNTVLIYQSDHGDYGGEFGLVDKSPTGLTDALTRVPMVIWAPGFFGPRGSHRALVEEVDVLPTIFEFAGLPVPRRVQGRSLAPVLRGQASEVREAVFAETQEDFSSKMVRTKDWKLIVHRHEAHELYDLRTDPGETRNLSGSHRPIETELRQRLETWERDTRA